jgi:hypothetical protein
MELAVSITFDARGTVPMGARLTDCGLRGERVEPHEAMSRSEPTEHAAGFLRWYCVGIVGIVLKTAHNAGILSAGFEKLRPRAHHFAENGWPRML